VIVEVERLGVSFPSGVWRRPLRALDAVSLTVREGDFLGLLGPNGAGKSTLMYCMLGLLRPTSGSVRMFGAAPELGGAHYARVAYLPEEPSYHDYLTLEEAVAYYGGLHGRRETPKAVQDLLERFGLGGFKRLRLAKCSKGMKQKVGIIQCLLNEPQLVFLDEPMRGLDPVSVKDFRDVLIEMNARGTTIVMNSHHLSEVEQVANRVAILDRGRLVAERDVESLTRVESNAYLVEIEGGGAFPEFDRQSASEGGAVFRVEAERLYDFFDCARQQGARIVSCERQRATLEESFLRVLKGDSADA
jgi:ABC-2 type transport system ATP-binding protein